MRIRFTPIFVFGVFLIATAAQPQVKSTQPEQQLKALMRQTLAAWQSLDPANAAPFYAQDAGNVFFDIAPLKYTGWPEYAEGVKKLLANYVALKFTLADDARVHTQGKFAWGIATFRLDAVKTDASKESLEGRWTVVWEKRGNNWLIVHEHVSVPLALAPPFQVTRASLTASPPRYEGMCPAIVHFTGEVTASGPGTVRYVFTRSDGAMAREQTLVFTEAGTKSVQTSWTLGGSYTGWQGIKIVGPNAMESEKAKFELVCQTRPSN